MYKKGHTDMKSIMKCFQVTTAIITIHYGNPLILELYKFDMDNITLGEM